MVATVQVLVPSVTWTASERAEVEVAPTRRRCHFPDVGVGPPERLNPVPLVAGVVAVLPMMIVTAEVLEVPEVADP
jgi:hypothetical protein